MADPKMARPVMLLALMMLLVCYVWWEYYPRDKSQALLLPGPVQSVENGQAETAPFPMAKRDPGHLDPVPSTLHYLWCGQKKFRFRHYLGLLSALKILLPIKVVFHYTHIPQTDNYNSWFHKIKKSVPALELRQLEADTRKCETIDMLKTILGFLSRQGGVYIGNSVMLGRPPNVSSTDQPWFAAPSPLKDKTQFIMIAPVGFDTARQEQYAKMIESSPKRCDGVDSYSYTTDCVLLERDLNPRDFMEAKSKFAELARLVFYDTSSPLVVKPDPSNPIPRISHFIKMENRNAFPYSELYKGELTFIHWLNILSALYVGGFQHVYIHAEKKPFGHFWDDLARENITYVPLERVENIYQQHIGLVQHVSDVMRYLILNKYGGAYQDFDVTWASRVPDWLLNYPTVLGMEWVRLPGSEYPESFNLGVFMTRPQSPWFRRYIETHQDYRDGDWGYNSLLMSYRTYELYPETVYLDRHLQVMCFAENSPPAICHPPWDKDYLRSIHDHRRTREMTNWREEVRAFHMTKPKPHPSMGSLEAVAKGKDIFADVARNVLKKSGREHMLNKH